MNFTKRSKNSSKYMILFIWPMSHNSIMPRGLKTGFKRIILLLVLMLFAMPSFAAQRIGVIYDSMLHKNSPYTAYSATPDFLAQDVIDELRKTAAFDVIPISEMTSKLSSAAPSALDINSLRNFKFGYAIDFDFLKKVSKIVKAKQFIVISQSMEYERDFLKNTAWNVANMAGWDVVNPTQRVTIYAALVDAEKESVLWEELYSKNIRNNKFKNLDNATAPNWEGMMRLKQYSKYVSPEIASNVTLALAPASFVPDAYLNKFEDVAFKVNKKIRIGSNKKLRNDNAVLHETFVIQQNATDAVKRGYKTLESKAKTLLEPPAL